MPTASVASSVSTLPASRWWGFVPFTAASAIHCGARAAGAANIAGPTKLTLMPLLAVAAAWSGRGLLRRARRSRPRFLLLGALLFSWLGDGAAVFFPLAPELPVMLGSFGVAHACYIWLLARQASAGRFPRWAAVFPLWWVLMLMVLRPALGALRLPVAAYGLLLAGTAATAARCRPMVAGGGLLFLASDTILAGRIFLPDRMPDAANPLVMLTYCAGQGLMVAGVLRTWREAP